MRLLDTNTLCLHEFVGSKIPNYAILSHKWEEGEVSFKDVTKLRNPQAPGWNKLRKSCEIAKHCGYDWIWIDTCCIDKSSSTELGESINSMFQWYGDAQICLTYLYDVRKDRDVSRRFKIAGSSKDSVWFSRGWTLQELLAPREIRFYDMDWSYLTTRSGSLNEIQAITGIDTEYLCGGNAFRRACIATKMSWMANRTTERKEDLAYAMLGIFNLNLAPIYGEGDWSFMRLQQTLLTNSTDESIFAWRMPNDNVRGMSEFWALDGWNRDEWGLLAPHPKCFKDSQGFNTNGKTLPRSFESFSMRQEGVQLPLIDPERIYRYAARGLFVGLILPCVPQEAVKRWKRVGDYYLPLNCWRRDEAGTMVRVQLHIRPCPGSSTTFKRCRCTTFKLDKVPWFHRYEKQFRKTSIVLQPQRAYS